jgi:hypothetical protein
VRSPAPKRPTTPETALKNFLLAAAALAAALCAPAVAAQDIRTEQVRFGAGQTGTTIAGRISGYDSVS